MQGNDYINDIVQAFGLIDPVVYDAACPIDLDLIVAALETHLKESEDWKGRRLLQLGSEKLEGLSEAERKKKVFAFTKARDDLHFTKVNRALLSYYKAYKEVLAYEVALEKTKSRHLALMESAYKDWVNTDNEIIDFYIDISNKLLKENENLKAQLKRKDNE